MKVCAHCQSAVPTSVIRCPQCGNLLLDVPPAHSADTQLQAVKVSVKETPFPKVEKIPPLGDNEVALMIVGNPHLVRVNVIQPIVFGRNFAKDSMYEGQVDLAALEAHYLGVSRRHARLDKRDDKFFLTDLGSSNGTLINNERLQPNKPYLLLNGARIQLGRLKMLLFHGPQKQDT